MSGNFGGLRRALITVYIVALHIALIYFVGERYIGRIISFSERGPAVVTDPSEQVSVPTPAPIPSVVSDELPQEPDAGPSPFERAGPGSLIIPVQGVTADQLTDTFAAGRANGRLHDAIDIMAPAGTPVLAAVDGQIVKFFDSVPGGTTIYQLSEDRRYIYYYAHLQRRADDVKEGDTVKQGKVIAYVGDTGNAGPGNYHLHFSIAQAGDPKRYWEGTYLDPYPYLKSGRAPDIK